jgi:hypothetical protein
MNASVFNNYAIHVLKTIFFLNFTLTLFYKKLLDA